MVGAALWELFEEEEPLSFGVGGGSPVGGVPLLPGKLADARLIVEAAFGANPSGDPNTWQYFDITTDVLRAPAVSISPMGRSDESSTAQPAGCSFVLKNQSGDYTAYNPAARWWPHLRRNTPIRVRVYAFGQFFTRFQGKANGWVPIWDVTGRFASVAVSASGETRRLNQGQTIRSALTRSTLATRPDVYWPLEDQSAATSGASALGGAALTADIDVRFAAVDGPAGSNKLPNLAADAAGSTSLQELAGSYGTGVDFEISFLFRLGSVVGAPNPDFTVQWYRATAGGVGGQWDVIISITNVLVRVGGGGGTTVMNPAVSTPNDNAWHHIRLRVLYGTGNRDAELFYDGISLAHPVAAPTIGELADGLSDFKVFATATNAPDIQGVGHLTGWAPPRSVPLSYQAVKGWPGETATQRITRLCNEEQILVAITGSATLPMGAQSIGELLPLLRECEATDDGLLYDGLSVGLGYAPRAARTGLTATLSPDAAADPPQVDDPFVPVDDDQRIRNLVTVEQRGGSSATAEDKTGPLGTGVVGTYKDTKTINPQFEPPLAARAAWEVTKGTVMGFRYPALNLDLAAAPALILPWLVTPLGGRVDVLNVATAAPQHPAGTVALMLEGYSETLSPSAWRITANCSPYGPWS